MNKRIFAILMLIATLTLSFIPNEADAKPQIIGWQWPTTDCDGGAIVQAELIESELIYSGSPIPMPSDIEGPCSNVVDPNAPVDASVVAIDPANTSTILNLQPGQTYYARIRVSAFVVGNWSSWSVEHQFTVPYGRPNRVIITSGILRFTSELISDPIIWLSNGRPSG